MLGSIKRHAQTALDSVERNAKAAINFLDKVFGAIVGVTLFSLTSLILNLLMSLALLAFTLSVRVALPIAAAFWAYKVTHSFPMTLFSTLMVLGLNRIILPPFLVLSSVRLALKAVEDLVYTVPYGLTEGYNKGLVHVIKQWWKIPFSFFGYLRAEDEDIRAINQNLFDLSVSAISFRFPSSNARIRSLLPTNNGEFPGTEEALQRSFNHPQPVVRSKLTAAEFEQFELKLPTNKSKTPFVPLSKEELLEAASKPELKSVLGHYNDLYKTLESYDKNPDSFDDQQIPMVEITTPIILVKQVRTVENPETWETLPAYIWLTDKENLQKWLATNTELPTNRNKFNGTDYIDGKPTRYRYYSYQTGTKNSPELHEMATTIRSRLNNAPSVSVKQEAQGFLASFCGLFGRGAGHVSAPVINPSLPPDTTSSLTS